MRNRNLLKSCVTEICVKRISINQEVGVHARHVPKGGAGGADQKVPPAAAARRITTSPPDF